MNKSISQRLEKLQERMAYLDIYLLALGPGANLSWLIGYSPHADERPSILIVTQEDVAMLLPELNAEDTKRHTDVRLHTWSDAQGPDKVLSSMLSEMPKGKGNNIAIDDTMRYDFAWLLYEHVATKKKVLASSVINSLRVIKDEFEIQILKDNAALTDRAVQAGFAMIAAGVTEAELADCIRAYYPSENAQPAFVIACGGENSAIPHHHAGDYKFKANDVVLIDTGCYRNTYCSDITRMATLGKPSAKYTEIHEIVEQAFCAALKKIKPGVKAKAVDKAARQVIENAGYGEYFVHRTGHGLGVDIHELPYLTSTSDTVLEPGMVFSVEPGIYLPGEFGVRLEEIVILNEDGPEILSCLPRTLHTIT